MKLECSREETFVSNRVRHAIRTHIISYVRPDGTLVARKFEAFSNQGAYASHGHGIVAKGMNGFLFGTGGTCLYGFHVYLKNGEEFPFFFGSNNGEQPVSDMEVSYWVYQGPEISRAPSKLCRGSMGLFFEMYEKYRPVK